MVCHGYLCRNWAGSFRYISTCGDEMDVKGLVVGGQLHLLSLLIPRRAESKRHDGEETLEVLKRLDEPATPLSLEMELKSEAGRIAVHDTGVFQNKKYCCPTSENMCPTSFHKRFTSLSSRICGKKSSIKHWMYRRSCHYPFLWCKTTFLTNVTGMGTYPQMTAISGC